MSTTCVPSMPVVVTTKPGCSVVTSLFKSSATRLPSRLTNAWILIFHFRLARFELPGCHQCFLQNIDRFEAGDEDRHPVAIGDRLVFALAHDRADMPRSKKSLHAIERRFAGW